ncbi:hypothetical protein LWI29_013149 [Acer saccharum]|uniref:Malectin-like domain-containing protein n=1 Tax=Acer saccharum TaxID=4024 RepID=A0AA39T251_ACESA|nr:hypothetical protein LWI29_013149 [Acer saccharum]
MASSSYFILLLLLVFNAYHFMSADGELSFQFLTYSKLVSYLVITFSIFVQVTYPDDNYDRIWFPAINSGIFTEATSSAIIANTLDNDPPTEVLRNAFITQNTSTAIVLRANLSLMEVPILMSMYPDDNYDRIWFPAINSGIFTETTSSAIIANTLDNDPPTEVLRNALITQNTSTAIVLRANLPLMEVPILMNMYFSEVDVLDSTEERSFEFYINDVIVSDPIIPPYGKVIQRYLKNFSASSNTS